ncbi:MarR family winged helix-turn-helix transcriptional regulator [Corynebacterium alimapuense]|uniref:MarR family transcriptional regulator n=1 Tax=Corynebacterium alimapuense TaxID=1576874 RepID=A0A3M8K983_9CORY|nr:MarR family transcriptional regulator [Corynebacterium alimapuense]RNE49696.1 MarR family transcriptional regulator [Corynebacterium alimapuense]
MTLDQAIRLSEQELTTWSNLGTVYSMLTSELNSQLRQDARLSHAEFIVLARLEAVDPHRLKMSGLAVSAQMTLSHLSRVASRLEERGLIVRTECPEDGRSIFAVLTEQGLQTFESAVPGYARQLRELVFNPLDEETQCHFSQAVNVIAKSFKPGNG